MDKKIRSGNMTVREAGRRGGQVVKQKYGPSFYEEIGKMAQHSRKRLIKKSFPAG